MALSTAGLAAWGLLPAHVCRRHAHSTPSSKESCRSSRSEGTASDGCTVDRQGSIRLDATLEHQLEGGLSGANHSCCSSKCNRCCYR